MVHAFLFLGLLPHELGLLSLVYSSWISIWGSYSRMYTNSFLRKGAWEVHFLRLCISANVFVLLLLNFSWIWNSRLKTISPNLEDMTSLSFGTSTGVSTANWKSCWPEVCSQAKSSALGMAHFIVYFSLAAFRMLSWPMVFWSFTFIYLIVYLFTFIVLGRPFQFEDACLLFSLENSLDLIFFPPLNYYFFSPWSS